MSKHHGVAKVAIAHKLAVRLYWMLRSGQNYNQIVERGSHTRILALRLGRGLHQQPAQQPIALLGDVPHPLLMLAAGRLGRNQPQIAAHLLAAGKASPVSQDQHVSQRYHRAYARMSHQQLRFGILRTVSPIPVQTCSSHFSSN
jgi:hypothetical protein